MKLSSEPVTAIRLHKLRQILSVRFNNTKSELAQAIKRSPSQVGQWFSGVRTISDDSARHIEAQLGLTRHELDYHDITQSIGYGDPDETFDSAEHERAVRETVRTYDSTLKSTKRGDYRYVTRVDGPHLSAGNGEVVWDFEEIDQSHAFRAEWMQKKRLNPDRCKLYTVRGDSMAYSINSGDLVMLNLADRDPVSGEIFALVTDDGLRVKRLHKRSGSWWLTSDNPDKVRYPDEQLTDEHAAIIGRVVWRGGDI